MRRSPNARALPAVLVLVVAGSLGCVDIVGSDIGRYTEHEEKRFTVAGRPEVTLSTFDGSIRVKPWDRNEVEVVVEKRAGSKESAEAIVVDVRQDGDKISVDARVPPSSGFFHIGRSASLTVSMPAAGDLTARSGDGSIDVERLNGTLDLHSGDGSIRARSIAGALAVTTGDGSVAVDGKLSSLRARSGDGSVRIDAQERSRAARDWDISTGDGSVTLALPSAFDAELDAHTGDGGIRLQDVTLSNVSGQIGRNSAKGRLGSGGAALHIRTGDGSITLRSARPSGTGDMR